VISIGTGLEKALQLNSTSQEVPKLVNTILQKTSRKRVLQIAVAEYCVSCLTSCETTHAEMAASRQKLILNGNYFRLNVPQGMSNIGLSEWDKTEDIIALTVAYMSHADQSGPKKMIAKLLLKPQLAG
jgi:hypothetical protein